MILVATLIAVGSLVPFADFVAAPLLVYAGAQIRAQGSTDRGTRLIGATAFGAGIAMGIVAAWSLVMIASLFAPVDLSAG